LSIRARVRDDQDARFLEHGILLVRVGTRGVAASDSLGTGVLRKLQHRALTVRARGLHDNVLRVFSRNNNASREHELVPRAAEVDDVNAIRAALPHVAFHLKVHVLGTEVATSREHHGDVGFLLGHLRGHIYSVFSVLVRAVAVASQRGGSVDRAFGSLHVEDDFPSRAKP
jgi:hypothetical protein